MRYYILVSNSPDLFADSLKGLPKDKIQVVINTLLKDQERLLVSVCEEYEVPYVITESDTRPATGKNCLMKCFLESDDEYGVFIDGGDVITPSGVQFYEELSREENPPDVLVLYKQAAVYKLDVDLLVPDMLVSDFPKKWEPVYPYDKSVNDICHMSEQELYNWLKAQRPLEVSLEMESKERYKFQQFMNEYSEDYEYMTRMVFISRKAAKRMHYDNSLILGEDTKQYLQLKKLAQEGHLRVLKKKDGLDKPPTYLQVIDPKGVVLTRVRNLTGWDWCQPFNHEMERMKISGELPEPYEVPEYL